MHDLIFEKQNEWSESQTAEELFIKYAETLALNVEQFKKDFDLEEIADKIENDLISGERVGVNATPTFFLNGRKISPRSYEEFKQLIDSEISIK